MTGVDNGDIPPVIQPSSLDASGNTYDALSMARKRARDREGKGGCKMAGATGFEPATSGVTDQRSNQLSTALAFSHANQLLNKRFESIAQVKIDFHDTSLC